MTRIPCELKAEPRRAMDSYRRKLEAKLQQNNTRDVWTGMREITGFSVRNRQALKQGSHYRIFGVLSQGHTNTELSESGRHMGCSHYKILQSWSVNPA